MTKPLPGSPEKDIIPLSQLFTRLSFLVNEHLGMIRFDLTRSTLESVFVKFAQYQHLGDEAPQTEFQPQEHSMRPFPQHDESHDNSIPDEIPVIPLMTYGSTEAKNKDRFHLPNIHAPEREVYMEY